MRYRLLIICCFMFSLCNAQVWETDLDIALSNARVQDKNIILVFNVNNCRECESLVTNVLSTNEFKDFAKDNYILAKIDFSAKNGYDVEQNSNLLLIVEKYNKDGFFPHVVEVDKFGKIIKKQPVYDGETAKEYISRF